MTDFASVLKSLPKYHRRPPREVPAAELAAKAEAMARRGYRHTEKSLEILEAYLQGYGVLISGGLGSGKSFFFETVEPEPIWQLSFNVCHLWKYDQLDEWFESTVNRDVVLDDIGWDADKSNNYGTKFEVLQIALDERLRQSGRTHITTNLTNDELIGKYDPHLIDRIYQLCKCFTLPQCESHRDAFPNWRYVENLKRAREMGKEEL